jgi:periplasmic protein TonB
VKPWIISFSMQSAAVLLLFTAASNKVVQVKVEHFTSLVMPDVAAYELKPARPSRGGGGGGDRSPLPASKGRLPKAALREFVPPSAVPANLAPKMTMDAAILAPPDMILPQVNMSNYGDPFGKVGPLSNGPGSGGGIGDGKGGGDGNARGSSFGPDDGDGEFGRGVQRVGHGVTAPALLHKVEPEYSEEARKAKYQGTVTLYVEVDPTGKATHIRVLRSLGLGLDEKAIQAVSKWRFSPGTKDGKPVSVAATIEVNFRLL